MKTLDQWFQEYGESHQNRKNQILHKICVPVIFFTVVGFLLLIPYAVGPLKMGEILLIVALAWYLSLGFRAFLVMLVLLGISYILFNALGTVVYPLIPLIVLFVIAWIGQFIGHNIEGKKPSFFKDLQFLLIGPLWVLRPLFKHS